MKKRTILWIVSIVTVIGLCVGIASYTRWLYGSVVVEEFSFTATQMKSLKKIENYDSLHKDTALVLTFSQKYPPSLYYHSFYSHLDMSQFPQKYSLAMSDQLSDVYDLILPGQTYNIKVTLEVPNPDMKYLPHMMENPFAEKITRR